jgi:hypothetical protein
MGRGSAHLAAAGLTLSGWSASLVTGGSRLHREIFVMLGTLDCVACFFGFMSGDYLNDGRRCLSGE